MDSQLERYERELLRLRARKTLLRADDVQKLGKLWDDFRPLVQEAQNALADFIGYVNNF